MSSCFRILSLDGGGIRGLITAKILLEIENRLEEELNQKLSSSFDLIAATSAGATLAAGIVTHKSMKEIYDQSIFDAQSTFSQPFWSHRNLEYFLTNIFLKSRISLLNPKYSGFKLDKILKSRFGDNKKLIDIDKDIKLMLISYDTQTNSPMIFKSWLDQKLIKNTDWIELENVYLWEAVRCSSSFPGFFPAFCLEVNDVIFSGIDGCVGSLNPSAMAVATAIEMGYAPQEIHVLSIGSGESIKKISLVEAQNWGMLKWLPRMFDIFTFGGSKFDNYIAEKIANFYLRLQPSLLTGYAYEDISDYYDDVSDRNINNLLKQVEGYLLQEKVKDEIDGFLKTWFKLENSKNKK